MFLIKTTVLSLNVSLFLKTEILKIFYYFSICLLCFSLIMNNCVFSNYGQQPYVQNVTLQFKAKLKKIYGQFCFPRILLQIMRFVFQGFTGKTVLNVYSKNSCNRIAKNVSCSFLLFLLTE